MWVSNYLVLERNDKGEVTMRQILGDLIALPMDDFEYAKLEGKKFAIKPHKLDIELIYDLDQFDDLYDLQSQVLEDIYMREKF